jgi:hypothetical protein
MQIFLAFAVTISPFSFLSMKPQANVVQRSNTIRIILSLFICLECINILLNRLK